MRLVLVVVLLSSGVALGQTDDPRPLGKAEVFGSVSGVKAKDAPAWYPGSASGIAVDLLHRPKTPLLFEYVAGGETANGQRLPFGHNYAGGGVRIGGVSGAFASVTVGVGTFQNGRPSTYSGTNVERTNSGPGLSVAGGSNMPVRPHWGVRAEVRMTFIAAVTRQWLFQVGGGLYYRFGKK